MYVGENESAKFRLSIMNGLKNRGMIIGRPCPPILSIQKQSGDSYTTTNAIEGFNRQLRKVTKSKTVFLSDDNLLKMLYLATMDITKKWTRHHQNWGQIHSQLEIYFEERLSGRNL